MKKLISRLFILAAMLTFMTACSDDEPENNKINNNGDIMGCWVATDNSNDFFIATSAIFQVKNMNFNSTGIYWNGQYTDLGVPTYHLENGVYLVKQFSSALLEIRKFNSKKGTMTIYNPRYTQSKDFKLVDGDMAIIKNDTNVSYSYLEVSVYSEADGSLIYSAIILNDGTLPTRSNPFWLGGVECTVKAKLKQKYGNREVEYAEWNNLKPGTYYTLSL